MFLITVNVVIIFFLLYAIVKAIKELNQMAEDSNEIEQICSRCRETVCKSKLKKLSPIEVYLLLISDINSFSDMKEYDKFTIQIANKFYHTQKRINQFLMDRRNIAISAKLAHKHKSH